jgi:hypothetical protein
MPAFMVPFSLYIPLYLNVLFQIRQGKVLVHVYGCHIHAGAVVCFRGLPQTMHHLVDAI